MIHKKENTTHWLRNIRQWSIRKCPPRFQTLLDSTVTKVRVKCKQRIRSSSHLLRGKMKSQKGMQEKCECPKFKHLSSVWKISNVGDHHDSACQLQLFSATISLDISIELLGTAELFYIYTKKYSIRWEILYQKRKIPNQKQQKRKKSLCHAMDG